MIFNNKRIASLVCIASLITSGAAMANVGSNTNATVNKGQLSAHWRNAYTIDDDNAAFDGRFRSRAILDYGFTDDFALRLQMQTDDPGNDNLELEAWIVDARFELTSMETHGYYSGFRLRYNHKDGDKKPDTAHIRLILGTMVDKWELRLNQIFNKEIGPDSRGGIAPDTRLMVNYNLYGSQRVGIESFSNFGYGSRLTGFNEQSHVIGPVFMGKLMDDLAYEAGYQYGVSDAAPEHTVKLFLIRYF